MDQYPQCMVTPDEVRAMALAFDTAAEAPHFEITSFRVKGKIFLTMNAAANHVTFRLRPHEQSMFHEYLPEAVYPVPNKWGTTHGWTHAKLDLVEEEVLQELLRLSYCLVAPKQLAARYRVEGE